MTAEEATEKWVAENLAKAPALSADQAALIRRAMSRHPAADVVTTSRAA